MDNILTYILDLQGNIDAKLKQINVLNEQQLDSWGKVQKQVNAANSTMSNMGKSIGSLSQRVAALRAQKEWIPAENTVAIRATNREIKALEAEINKLNSLNGGKLSKWWGDLKNSMPFQMLTNPIVLATAAVGKLNQYVGESEKLYKAQAEAEAKLAAVMNNTMGATGAEVQSILDLASAQQKLGVIDGSVQIAGAQELGTYLSKKESMQKLIPAMNDMLAQQYGLNASQEQAAQIGSMLGKVMQGQTGALSRYGYSFTKAQEQILKTGTEAQRAAILFDVVNESVGGVNKALAQTPEGKLKQHANEAEDLQGRVGKLAVQIQAAFLPVKEFFLDIGGSIVGFFERFYETVQKHRTLFTVLATAIGIVTLAIIIYAAWQKITAAWTAMVTFFKAGEAAAWWAATVPMLITVGIIAAIIAAIVVVIATIVYCVKHVTGWGDVWDATVNFAKNSFFAFVEGIKLYFTTLINGLMMGIDKIRLGWYKFKEAMGIGNSNENQAAIAKINADVEARQKAIVDGAKKVADYANKAKHSFDGVSLKTDGTSLSEFIGGATKKLGINGQLQNAVDSGNDNGDNGAGNATNTAIATGGTRNTTIHIKIDDMIKQVVFNGNTGENMKEIERNFAEALYRVLAMAEVSMS